MSTTLDTVRALSATISNEHVERLRAEGGRVVGYACTLTPVEVLDAAGLFPFRIKALGHPQTDRADARLSRFNCRFCRACLQLGLDGTYDFLDGLVETNGCDQLRGMFENWQYAVPRPFFHYVKVPHAVSTTALDHLVLEIDRFREAVAAYFEAPISDEALWEAIGRQARIREKLAALQVLREGPRPTLGGADSLRVALAGSSVPPAVFERLLDELLRAPPGQAARQGHTRLLMGGAATDEPALLEAVEELGGQIVTDTFCYGARSYLPQSQVAVANAPGSQAAHADAPVRALAERILRGSRCPRMYADFERRLDFLRASYERAAAQGVILLNNKFCDLHGFDNAMLRRRLEADGVPVLSLEKDYGSQADQGRLRTRVQAFLERIGGAA